MKTVYPSHKQILRGGGIINKNPTSIQQVYKHNLTYRKMYVINNTSFLNHKQQPFKTNRFLFTVQNENDVYLEWKTGLAHFYRNNKHLPYSQHQQLLHKKRVQSKQIPNITVQLKATNVYMIPGNNNNIKAF